MDMWFYEKKLEHPVRISKPDANMAKLLLSVYGGPNGELSAALQYLNQRYSATNDMAKAVLTDIGTEELAHLEIIAAMITKLLKDVSPKEMKCAGLGSWYAHHKNSPFYTDSNNTPWSASYIITSGDTIADLYADIAVEERARATYEYLINLSEDPDVIEVLKFLKEREVVHAQRFGEVLNIIQGQQNQV